MPKTSLFGMYAMAICGERGRTEDAVSGQIVGTGEESSSVFGGGGKCG